MFNMRNVSDKTKSTILDGSKISVLSKNMITDSNILGVFVLLLTMSPIDYQCHTFIMEITNNLIP